MACLSACSPWTEAAIFVSSMTTRSAVLLRAFYVAPEHQGHGYATAAVGATRALVQQRLPDVKRVVLTVNHRNPAAIVTYLKGGFVKSGEDYLGGLKGPPHVMVLEI